MCMCVRNVNLRSGSIFVSLGETFRRDGRNLRSGSIFVSLGETFIREYESDAKIRPDRRLEERSIISFSWTA